MLATVVATTAVFALIFVTHSYIIRAIYADALGVPKGRKPSNSIPDSMPDSLSKLHYEKPFHPNQ